MRGLTLLGVAMPLLWGCGITPAEPVASAGGKGVSSSRRAIVGGADDAADPQVFLIDMAFDNATQTICSATLLAPRTLVTAAHCVDPRRQSGATSVTIKATNKMVAATATVTERIDVLETRLHPSWDPVAASSPNDIALLLLGTAVTGAPGKEVNRAGLSGFTGQSMRVVGYGRTDPATANSGTRRAVTLAVTSDDAEHIFFGASAAEGICAGDSGGPSFHTFGDGVERIVGIHSYVKSAQCGDGADVRIDRFLGFIDTWLAEKDPPLCSADGRCKSGCAPIDPDCAANLNPAVMGDPCTDGVDLCEAGSVCSGPEGTATTCRPACDSGGACPAGAACVAGQGGVRYCRAQVAPDAPPASGDAAGHFGCQQQPAASLPWMFLALLAIVRRRFAQR